MRVYHFVCKHYGVENLRKRRLKVSCIENLNDPFEFLAVKLSDPSVRQVLRNTKHRFGRTHGLVCFSETWRSPLMWAHYADKHKGVCLGFDVPEDFVHPVVYVPKREFPPPRREMLTQDFAQGLFLKKFWHWRYEKERRAVVQLHKCKRDGEHYFVRLSDELALKQVIVGAESDISRNEMESALRESCGVEMFKARPARRTFRLVRQLRKDLW